MTLTRLCAAIKRHFTSNCGAMQRLLHASGKQLSPTTISKTGDTHQMLLQHALLLNMQVLQLLLLMLSEWSFSFLYLSATPDRSVFEL